MINPVCVPKCPCSTNSGNRCRKTSHSNAQADILTRNIVIFLRKETFQPKVNTPINEIRLTIKTLANAYIQTIDIEKSDYRINGITIYNTCGIAIH